MKNHVNLDRKRIKIPKLEIEVNGRNVVHLEEVAKERLKQIVELKMISI